MKGKIIMVLLLFALLPFLAAMGTLQEQSPGKIPIPKMKFAAAFVDQTDIVTDCRDVSIDGETFLEGKRGTGTNAIPFENISEVSFLYEGENLNGIIKLRDDNTVTLSLNKNQRAYGNTKYGTFPIKLSDLKKMTIDKAP